MLRSIRFWRGGAYWIAKKKKECIGTAEVIGMILKTSVGFFSDRLSGIIGVLRRTPVILLHPTVVNIVESIAFFAVLVLAFNLGIRWSSYA
jgi:hypothetical protein